ncbi:MAG: hypothetical protein WCL37_08240 [Chrysiogenales bacterium]
MRLKTMIPLMIFSIMIWFRPLAAQPDLGKYTYGIKLADSVTTALAKARKLNFKIVKTPMQYEDGPGTAFSLYRKKQLIMVIVPFNEKNIFWIDVRGKNLAVEGIVIGSDLFRYYKKGLAIRFDSHRDCSFDDITCFIGDNKITYLVDQAENMDLVQQYKNGKNPELLKKIHISGCQVRKQIQ